jgi:peptidoglycan/xylan/chitin deacetylase (PgdA/CDA1 family)
MRGPLSRALARAAGRFWSRLTEQTDVASPCIPILCYHAIADRPHAVSPARFAAQMRWLRRHGYEAVSLEHAIEAGARDGRRWVVITFDDGLADIEREALPALAACRFSATVFFPPALAGATRWYSQATRGFVDAAQDGARRLDFMSWRQAEIMAKAGVSFQSHGWSHPRLSALPDGEIAEQLARSREELQQRFGAPVWFLSYPFGDYDQRVQRLAASIGYKAALTTIPGFNDADCDRYALRRVAPNARDDLSSFAFKLSPAAGGYYHCMAKARKGN